MFDEELVPPQQLNPSISDRINQAILKGMALEPEDRPSLMGEWLGLLAPLTQTNRNLEEVDKKPTLPLFIAITSLLKNRSIGGITAFILLVVGVPTGISLLPQNPLQEDASIPIPPSDNSTSPIETPTDKVTETKTQEPPSAELLRGDYSRLENFLKQKKWKEADQETYQVMLKVAGSNSEAQGRFNLAEWQNFPCPDFKEIDRLWSEASNGRLGFSVQNRILDKLRDYHLLYIRIGWVKESVSGNNWEVAWYYNQETKTAEYIPQLKLDFDDPLYGQLPAKLEWETPEGGEPLDRRFEAVYRCRL
ncbi:MAG: hypothetical protein F6J89_18130 [Symploca sp. SIO1C4]|uniref:GUN4-like domain-containing protein n=1 Tax=Symploca sp. SIO1C4 TaxID=2607765 RepID=A0A6B3NEX8_9CYAN|nr:hypothetical protein [Symploca sp. SIO1C4]